MQPFSEVPIKPDVSDAAKLPEANVDRPDETEGWKNSIELPDDTGEWVDSIELPDDSGEWQDNIELPDDSGKEIPNTSSREKINDARERELPEKMERITIVFKYPENADGVKKKEFERQLKAQERGLNSQSVAENMENRENYQQRKNECGNGRSPEALKAQLRAREKAETRRIETNQKKGMSLTEAREEAKTWLETQAALHNPDQIAGGDPSKVSRMGDKDINSSIGGQWTSRVDILAEAVDAFAKNYSKEELAQIKMNVKLEVE